MGAAASRQRVFHPGEKARTDLEPSRPEGSTTQVLLEGPNLRVVDRLPTSECVAQLSLQRELADKDREVASVNPSA